MAHLRHSKINIEVLGRSENRNSTRHYNRGSGQRIRVDKVFKTIFSEIILQQPEWILFVLVVLDSLVLLINVVNDRQDTEATMAPAQETEQQPQQLPQQEYEQLRTKEDFYTEPTRTLPAINTIRPHNQLYTFFEEDNTMSNQTYYSPNAHYNYHYMDIASYMPPFHNQSYQTMQSPTYLNETSYSEPPTNVNMDRPETTANAAPTASDKGENTVLRNGVRDLRLFMDTQYAESQARQYPHYPSTNAVMQASNVILHLKHQVAFVGAKWSELRRTVSSFLDVVIQEEDRFEKKIADVEKGRMEEREELEKEIEVLEKKVGGLKNRLKRDGDEMEMYKSRIGEMSDERQELYREIDRLKKVNERLERENGRLGDELFRRAEVGGDERRISGESGGISESHVESGIEEAAESEVELESEHESDWDYVEEELETPL